MHKGEETGRRITEERKRTREPRRQGLEGLPKSSEQTPSQEKVFPTRAQKKEKKKKQTKSDGRTASVDIGLPLSEAFVFLLLIERLDMDTLPSSITAYHFLVIGLLRGALHPLSTRGHVIVIIVQTSGSGTVGTGLRALASVNALQLEVLDHGVGRGLGLLDAGREDLLEELEVLQLILLGELDIELDVKVAVVVVAE